MIRIGNRQEHVTNTIVVEKTINRTSVFKKGKMTLLFENRTFDALLSQ